MGEDDTSSRRPEPSDQSETGANDARTRPHGVTIRGYEILRELFRGGQGVVYKAVQKSTNRNVAIKLLLEGRDTPGPSQQRFEREIRLIAQLGHANVISIHDSGVTEDGRHYYVMDYVRGVRLDMYVRENKVPLDRVLDLVKTICEAVDFVHQKGVIHRDLKPSNILIDADEVPKILDFGLAKPMADEVSPMVSVTGQFVGTLRYSSPEQLRGRAGEIDVRTDVYALGVILYELLTAHSPYPHTNHMAEWIKHVAETPPRRPRAAWDRECGVQRSDSSWGTRSGCPIDRDLETIVLTALSKDRTLRYRSAGALARDIEHYTRGEPIEARGASVAYKLTTHARTFACRHRVTAFVAVLLISTLLAQWIGVPLVFRWTEANVFFENTLDARVLPAAIPTRLNHVRVIGIMDDTDFEGLASGEGFEGVSTGRPKSWRGMHGRLMERLASSGCRSVVWDIMFRAPSEFDDDFVHGVTALGEVDVDVIVAMSGWRLDERGLPDVSEKILAADVGWGAIQVRTNRMWGLQLVAQQGAADPIPAAALAAFASNRHPGWNTRLDFDPRNHVAELRYWKPGATAQAETFLDKVDRIELTFVAEGEAPPHAFGEAFGAASSGLDQAARVGFYLLPMPPNGVLSEATTDYQDIFSADPQQLQRWCRGKSVLICNLRSDASDRASHPDGREDLSACYAHAVGIEALNENSPVRMPRATTASIISFIGAALGAISVLVGRRLFRVGYPAFVASCTIALSGCAVLVVASIVVYWKSKFLVNPLVAVFALLVACLAAARLDRMWQSGRA